MTSMKPNWTHAAPLLVSALLGLSSAPARAQGLPGTTFDTAPGTLTMPSNAEIAAARSAKALSLKPSSAAQQRIAYNSDIRNIAANAYATTFDTAGEKATANTIDAAGTSNITGINPVGETNNSSISKAIGLADTNATTKNITAPGAIAEINSPASSIGITTDGVSSGADASISSTADTGTNKSIAKEDAPESATQADAMSLRGSTSQSNSIAQSIPTDTTSGEAGQVELTPVSLPRRTPAFNRFDEMKTSMLMRLPPRLFFSAVIDNSIRLETNVYQTAKGRRSDFVY